LNGALAQLSQLSEEVISLVESRGDLLRLEQLEAERRALLEQLSATFDVEEASVEEAGQLKNIQQLNRLILTKVEENKIELRDKVAQKRRNQRKLKAYR